MSRKYTIRFTESGASSITAVSNYSDLMDLVKGSAAKAIIETKMSEGMPLTMHNAIADHNAKVRANEKKPPVGS
jgi:hypothetical protein